MSVDAGAERNPSNDRQQERSFHINLYFEREVECDSFPRFNTWTSPPIGSLRCDADQIHVHLIAPSPTRLGEGVGGEGKSLP